MSCVILVADGARPDTLRTAMDAGRLPALDALRRAGGDHVVTSVFPSVTGPAWVPFLTGRHPGEVGIPGIRWWDRAGTRAYAHGSARSYVGFEALRQDGDLDPSVPTLFDLARRPLAALTPIGRGLPEGARLGTAMRHWPRLAWTHFRGDVRGWLRLEHALAEQVADRVDAERPDLVVFGHQCVDKLSHQLGHDAPEVLEALGIVDAMVARLTHDAARSGAPLSLIVVSDHGHSPVAHHLDLADAVRAMGHGVCAHPFPFLGGDEVAVMVGGNAMAHLHLELTRPARPWWPRLAARWTPFVDALLALDAVGLLLLPLAPDACEVRSRAGRAIVSRVRTAPAAGATDARAAGRAPGDPWRYSYRTLDGDPLRLAASLGASAALDGLDADAAHDACAATPFPDALVQVLAIAGSPRAGDLILSAAPGWDLRARWEPIPHRSTHGSLHAEHLRVPLLTSAALPGTPRRTTEVFALARAALDAHGGARTAARTRARTGAGYAAPPATRR